MAKVKISRFIAFLASGSDISRPGSDSGYDEGLAIELDRIGTKGGVVDLTPLGLRDLAEWLDAIGMALGYDGNTSGARACAKLAEVCRDLAED
jgi:hypothetical protein